MSEIAIVKAKNNVPVSPYFVMVVLMLGVFMTALDTFVVSPALPTMMANLRTSLDMVTWTITIFMLFYTAVMPLGGKLSDIYGRKKIYVVGLAIFTIGSIACSLAWDIYSLLAFRALLAIGAALVYPAALSFMNSAAPEDKKGKTMGALMAMGAIAMIVGPNLGGYFIQHFGWRTVFYINVPIGIVAILLSLKFNESYGEKKQHIDILGSGLLVGMLATLLYGLVRLETIPLTDVTVFPFILAAIIFAIILVWYEKRVPGPILNIPLISRGDVLSLNLAFASVTASLILVMAYVPSFAQVVLHMNVQDSGSILTPLSIMTMIGAIIGGALIDKFGTRPMLFISCLTSCLVLLGLALYVNDATSLAIILALLGLTLGLGMGAFQIIMLSFMPESEKATGSGILGTFKNAGGSIGSVIGAFFLADATRNIVTYDHAFSNIFQAGAILAVLGTAFVAYLILRGQKTTATTVKEAQH